MSFLQLFQSCDENHQNFFFRTIKITFTINITTLPQRKKKTKNISRVNRDSAIRGSLGDN